MLKETGKGLLKREQTGKYVLRKPESSSCLTDQLYFRPYFPGKYVLFIYLFLTFAENKQNVFMYNERFCALEVDFFSPILIV